MADSEPTRQAESKVIPPARTDIKYPQVAVIPPGQTSVVILPKTEKEIDTEHPQELVIRHDVAPGEPTPK